MKKVQQYMAEMADREAIRDCLYRYCRSVDRFDVELMRSTYWPDASIDYGPTLRAKSWDEIIKLLRPHLEGMYPSKHMLGNILIEVAGDKAYVESYHHSFDSGKNPDGSEYERISSGRYLDQMERRDGEWRFLHRVVVLDWNKMWPVGPDGGVKAVLREMPPECVGARKPHDRVYTVLKAPTGSQH
jgi:ketosteroid isomerase-like protein